MMKSAAKWTHSGSAVHVTEGGATASRKAHRHIPRRYFLTWKDEVVVAEDSSSAASPCRGASAPIIGDGSMFFGVRECLNVG